MAGSKAPDPKSPPKSQRSHRALSQRAMQHSHREPDHEAFGLTPPPTSSEISSMMLVTAVRALKDFESDAETVAQVCTRIVQAGGRSAEARQQAADAGALQALHRAMNIHAKSSSVQERAIVALGNICCGTDAAGLARKQLAAPCIYAIVAAMEEHPDVAAVQENGCATLGNIASNIDEEGLARKQTAYQAGAFAVIVAAMKRHQEVSMVQDYGCFAIGNLCRARGDATQVDEAAVARKRAAVEQGALDAVVNAMKSHPAVETVQEHGARALSNLTFKNDELKTQAAAAGAAPEWLSGLTTARAALPDDPQREKETTPPVEVS